MTETTMLTGDVEIMVHDDGNSTIEQDDDMIVVLASERDDFITAINEWGGVNNTNNTTQRRRAVWLVEDIRRIKNMLAKALSELEEVERDAVALKGGME